MTKDEALRVAIEHIRWADHLHDWHDGLYAALNACKQALAQPTQKPLTDDAIAELWGEKWSGSTEMIKNFARAIEKAHGIGG